MPQARFNNYLPTILVALLAGGCATPEERQERKEASTLRLYLEEHYETAPDETQLVPIYRANPIPVRIQNAPFLNESTIKDAAIVETMGGYAIRVNYDFHGSLVLENVTTSYRGRRIVVYCMFTEGRWLAAPMITATLGDGEFTFTPDATREEAERIVRGLRNMAVKMGNREHTSKPTKKEKDVTTDEEAKEE